MIRLLGGLLCAALLIACSTVDCGWVVELNEDDEAHLSYVCNY